MAVVAVVAAVTVVAFVAFVVPPIEGKIKVYPGLQCSHQDIDIEGGKVLNNLSQWFIYLYYLFQFYS